MSEPLSFVDAVLAGQAFATDVDDWVDAWHAGTADASDVELPRWLGLTWDEYALWVEEPTALRFIIAAHSARTTVTSMQTVSTLAAAAARANNDSEAAKVVEWLRRTKRLSE